MPGSNLDLVCARRAEIIGKNLEGTREKDLEKLVGASSSVLTRHGPYALFLYLSAEKARAEKHKPGEPPPPTSAASFTLSGEAALLGEVFLNDAAAVNQANVLAKVKTLSEDFEKLLLARKVLEQTLTYLRYHVKAITKETANDGGQGQNRPPRRENRGPRQ
jgi:hypothetical protein